MPTATSFVRLAPFAVVTALLGCGAPLPAAQDTADAAVPEADAPAPSRADGSVPLSAPRPRAPLSTATVTTRRPTLRWAPGAGSDGTRIEVCRDRACTRVVHAIDVSTDRNQPNFDLPPATYFWRLFARVGGHTDPTPGPTWTFVVGPRTTPVDTSWGTTLDLNGDGYADLAASTSGPTRRVVIHHGSPTGLGREPATVLPLPDAGPGAALGSAGDVNGDGYGDLLVQSGYTMVDGNATFHVQVLSGSATGVAPTPATTLDVPAPGCLGEMMVSLASAGDVNGDGYGDVVVGAPCADSVGRVYVFLGGPTGLGATPAAMFSGRTRASRFGWSVAAADFNGDGLSDIAVNAWGSSNGWSGEVTVFSGTRAGIVDGARTMWEPGVLGSASTLACGDVNGDGYADLAVASRGGGSASPTGVVLVFAGSARSLGTAAPLATLIDPMPPARGAYFAGDLGVRDLNGDGYADVVATSYSASEQQHRLQLFDGGPTGPAPRATDTLARDTVRVDHYASGQLALGDHDGDGRADLSVLGSAIQVFPSGPSRGPSPSLSLAAPAGEQFSTVVGSR